MTLSKGSRLAIFLTAWTFITAFVAIKAYDSGYIAGMEMATRIFVGMAKVVQ